jgi:hypothetical protein
MSNHENIFGRGEVSSFSFTAVGAESLLDEVKLHLLFLLRRLVRRVYWMR